MVIKVQISDQSTICDCPQVLIYDQDRTVCFMGDLSDQLRSVTGYVEGLYKGYFEAELKDKELHIGNKTRDHYW